MHDAEVQQQFISLRAKGQSFAAIAEALNVSRGTLVNWSRKFRFEIQNLHAIEMEALQEQLIASKEVRAKALAQQLCRVETELTSRNLADIPTAKLFSLAESLRRQIVQETGDITFTAPIRQIPDDEYCEHVQDWNP